MAEKKLQPIIVKRIKKAGHAPHGGAWKIAYADFVTAMMAFFLLMWLLGSTAKGELQGIAAYFSNPVQVSLGGGDGSGNSSSILPGGGNDLSKAHGQVRKSEADAEADRKSKAAARLEKRAQAQQDARRMAELQNKIESLITENPKLREYKSQIRIEVTPDGLQIQIVDDQKRPMFDSGSALVKSYMRDILREIGSALGNVENKISLAGHTDATPYGNGDRGYGNWELSSDRANATRRELVGAGMPDAQLVRVVGLAASDLLDKADARAPANRRISITVMTREAEQRLLGHAMPEVPADELSEAVERMDASGPAAAAPAAKAGTGVAAGSGTTASSGADVLPTRRRLIDLPARPPRSDPAQTAAATSKAGP